MLRFPLFARTLTACALLASAALAGGGTVVETFVGGVNNAGWSYGPPSTFPTSGGNPDDYLRTLVDTFAPQLRSSGPSAFTGNYRTKNVTSVGVDLNTFSLNFPAAREATLMLTRENCSVFFLGTEMVPQPGTGWVSFDYSFDPHSPTMPSGWATFGTCTDPDAAWNFVMTGVTQVNFFYGNPDFFYIFDQWTVGADNMRITTVDPWEDLGGGTVGINGQPTLEGLGSLTANSVIGVSLTNGPSSELSLLWIALAPSPFAALGGTVHAFPNNAQIAVFTSGAGTVSGVTPLPAVASGTQFTFQFLCQDLTTLHDITLSNGVRATAP